MQPLDLIATAKRMATAEGSRRRRQSDLKRAISTAYYAMFHALCRNCADCMVGKAKANRSEKAWCQAYRAAEHGFAKGKCKNKPVIGTFPIEIADFAKLFVRLQEKRHEADYDPASRFTRSDTIEEIDTAERAIRQFQQSNLRDWRAFAVWTVMKGRSA